MAAEKRCVIISASPEADIDFIRQNIQKDDYIICADGGLDTALKASITPNLIVGDFDSVQNTEKFPQVETISLEVRKMDTDTMHCVDVALERGFSNFLLLGATGGRTDHLLANLSILIYLSNKKAYGKISDRYNDVTILRLGKNIVETPVGTTVSIIPFGDTFAEVSYKGMSYPLQKGIVKVEYPYTISNKTVTNNACITLHSGRALLIIVHAKY